MKMEKIGNVAQFKRGPFGSSVKKSVCVNKGPNTYKLYEQGNVINNDFKRGAYYLTEEKFKELSQFEIAEGDLLLTCAGTLGRIAIVPDKFEKGVINSVLMRIRVNEDKIHRKYLYFYFQSPNIQNNINNQSPGVAIKNLFSTKLLKEYTLYLPEKDEQQLIVDEVEKQFTRLDTSIKELKEVKRKLEVYRKSVLKAAFEGKLFDSLDKWIEEKLNECCKKVTDGSHYTPKYILKGIPFVTIKDRKDGKIDFESCNKISLDDFNKLKKNDCNPKKGDILYSKDGTVGEVIKINFDKDFIVLSSWAIIRPKDHILQEYLKYYMQSDTFLSQATKLKTGTAITRIVLRNLKQVIVRYPKNIETQRKIVNEIESRFSVIDKVGEIINNALLKAEQLRKSILKSAFEGKLVKYEGDLYV